MGSSRCFSLVGVYRGMLRFGALGLVLIISPFFKLKIAHRFFSWIPYSSRDILSNFQDFFATGSTGWHPVQPVQPVHRVSRCRTLIFGNYFDHISFFRTRNYALFVFMNSSLFQEHSFKFSKFFATCPTGWHPVQPVHRVSWCKTLIFGNYFDHISLFRTRNCVPFFSWIPHSSRNILSNFQIFLQPVRPVGIRFSRFSRFIESTGVKH